MEFSYKQNNDSLRRKEKSSEPGSINSRSNFLGSLKIVTDI